MPQISQNQMDYISGEHDEIDESQKENNCNDCILQDNEHNVGDMEQRMLEGTQSGNCLK